MIQVKRFRDPCLQHLNTTGAPESGTWNESQDRVVIDFVNDVKSKSLFVSVVSADGQFRFDSCVVGHVHLSKPTCFFIKADHSRSNEPLIRSSQYETAIYQGCLARGAADLPRHLARVAFHFEKQTFLMCDQRLKGIRILVY